MHGGGGVCGRGRAWQGGVRGKGVACVRGRIDDHCSGRYTIYWNAFLHLKSFVLILEILVHLLHLGGDTFLTLFSKLR